MQYDQDRRNDSRRGSGGGHGGGGGDRDRGGRGRGRGPDGEGGRGMPLSELDPALTSTSHKVIGCARDVHMALGPGFERSAYFDAVVQELNAQQIPFKMNHAFDVRYKGTVVGKSVADLFIADRFVVQIMANPGEIGSYERAVLRAQLRAGDLELGLIINFAGRLLKDGLVRVLNPDKLQAMRGDSGGGHGHNDEAHTHHDDHDTFDPEAGQL